MKTYCFFLLLLATLLLARATRERPRPAAQRGWHPAPGLTASAAERNQRLRK